MQPGSGAIKRRPKQKRKQRFNALAVVSVGDNKAAIFVRSLGERTNEWRTNERGPFVRSFALKSSVRSASERTNGE